MRLQRAGEREASHREAVNVVPGWLGLVEAPAVSNEGRRRPGLFFVAEPNRTPLSELGQLGCGDFDPVRILECRRFEPDIPLKEELVRNRYSRR